MASSEVQPEILVETVMPVRTEIHESTPSPSPLPLSDTYPVFFHLLQEQVKCCDNPYVTFETLTIRLVKEILTVLNVSWPHFLETIRQGPCVLDKDLHRQLQHMLTHRKKTVTTDEQHCIERVLGRDHNRLGDLVKLTGILSKIADPLDVCIFYAVDGFLGDDPRRYIDSFKYSPGDWQYRHVLAVRQLYLQAKIESPTAMRSVLESIFRQEPSEHNDLYMASVGSWELVKEIAAWRLDKEERGKKKRATAEEEPSSSKKKKSDDEE